MRLRTAKAGPDRPPAATRTLSRQNTTARKASPHDDPAHPTAVTGDGGVDLFLPPETPLGILDAFVASCNIGECGCGDSFDSRITGVELCDEPGHRRVRINGNITPTRSSPN